MPASTKKILIAEDERALANALKLKLEKAGFKATIAFDGLAAIESLKTERFDLLLLDLLMPKADGFQVLSAIKEQKKNIPTIILSNSSQAQDEKKARELGAIAFYIKSDIALSSLVEKIKGVINA